MIDEDLVRFTLALSVLIAGLLFLLGLYRFGTELFRALVEKHFFSELWRLMKYGQKYGHPLSRSQWWSVGFSVAYENYLEKRNEFWQHYGQVALAVLIVVILAVLLLVKAISAEAGLPILSAVAGFAIAKSNSGSSNIRRPESPPERNSNNAQD